MTFQNYKATENAETTFDGDVSASSTTWIVHAGEGALFPTTYPFLLTAEKYNTSDTPQVIGREIVKVTGSPATDQFTVVRQFSTCVQNDTLDPKVQSNGPQTFSSGDKISLYKTAIDDEDIKNEVARLETDKLDKNTYESDRIAFASTSTGTDAYAITVTGDTSYVNGKTYKVEADVANTGTATLDVNTLGAKTLKKLNAGAFEDLSTNDIIANQIFWATYSAGLDAFIFSVDPANVTIPATSYTQSTITAGENLGDRKAIVENSGKFLSDASNANLINFLGFTTSAITSGNTGDIATAGVLGGFSGLTTGNKYYLVGTIGGYNLSTASYDSISFSIASQDTSPGGISFKSDGTKMYICGASSDTVYQYTLSTAWDLSTASYDSVNFSVSSQDTSPEDISFKSDGTKMYICGASSDTVYQYTLSTAWDLSTASYDSVNFSVTSQDTTPTGLSFKSDGTKMYICGASSDTVYQYTLSTAWDLSTASYDSVNFSVTSQDTIPVSISFNIDGTRMFILGSSNDSIYQYTLSTAWDLSTASYDSISFSIASQEGNPSGLFFGNNGYTIYMVGSANDTVYQYTTGVSGTAGGISTTPGTNSILVGKALSSTELLINAGGF